MAVRFPLLPLESATLDKGVDRTLNFSFRYYILTMVWPPDTLTIQSEEIINQCEVMEVLPSSSHGKQFISVVEMAALLYRGEYTHARHAWNRWKDNNPPSILADWWKVGEAMSMLSSGGGSTNLTELATKIWTGLRQIQYSHPSPISLYAEEVGTAFRKRILQQTTKQPPPQPYWSLLNFSSVAEYEKFYRYYGTSLRGSSKPRKDMVAKSSLTYIAAMLDTDPPSSMNKVPA